MKLFDVITIGSALRDHMFYTDACVVVSNPDRDPTRDKMICVEYGAKIRSEHVYFEFGGGAANTAVNFAGLGLHTGILTRIGKDVDGQAIEENLTNAGVDTEYIQTSTDHRTGFSFLLVDEVRRDHAAFVYYGAAQDLTVDPTTLEKLTTDWYYIGSLNTPNWESILEAVFARDTHIAWNPGGTQIKAGFAGLEKYIRNTDILILNKDEATELVLSHPEKKGKTLSIEEIMKTVVEWGAGVVVITDGRHGSYACDGAVCYRDQIVNEKPVDTTGAGDCYGSSFVTGMIKYQGDIQKSMRLATVNANAAVQSIGAQSGLLKWDQLSEELKTQK